MIRRNPRAAAGRSDRRGCRPVRNERFAICFRASVQGVDEACNGIVDQNAIGVLRAHSALFRRRDGAEPKSQARLQPG